MPVKMSSSPLLILPSDTLCYTAIDKPGTSFHPNGIVSSHKLSIPMSARDDSPFINRQLSDGSSVTSLTDASDDELQVNDDVDSDTDEAVPRKRQKTQTGSNTQITISNVLLKSWNKNSTVVDGGWKEDRLPGLQNFATRTVSAVDSEDTRVTRVAISNTEPSPSPTTSISSCAQIDSSPTTTTRTTPAKEGKEDKSISTLSRKRVNGMSGLLVSRPLAMSRSISTSDSLNSGVLKDRDGPPIKTRGSALRPTNWSYGTKLKKSQGRIADQDELELWTNADVAHIGFRKPDELILLDKVEEESTKRNLSHILTCLMEMEAKSSSENMARNEGVISNCDQTQVATPESVGEKKTFKAPEWTKMVKNIQSVDGLEGQEDEEMRDHVNSPQVPPPQLECWSTTIRSLLKGKKKFQRQDLIDFKDALQEIYNKRANISAASSLAQEVYQVTQLEIHDVPNQDELRLRALARKSTQYWNIGGQRDA